MSMTRGTTASLQIIWLKDRVKELEDEVESIVDSRSKSSTQSSDHPTTADDLLASLRSRWQINEGWIPVGNRLPEDKTPVLVLFHNGERNIGELRWESPGYEESYQAFQYWDNPTDDGKAWEWGDITHWQPLPPPPKEGKE
jgi:hypothetical protein